MGADKAPNKSRLFLVRLWQERDDEHGEEAWRGRVLHVVSGKAGSFREWPELVNLLTEVLSGTWAEATESSHEQSEVKT